MNDPVLSKVIEVLLVEDNMADVRLTQEALKDSKVRLNLSVAEDGVVAMDYLRRRGSFGNVAKPDLILLDLNLPRKDGRETLAEIKADETLKQIPVVILTTSESEEDIVKTYKMHANCYVTKPVDFDRFREIVRQIEDFWFTVVKLPQKP
jgi:two-component system, chemotaxis family, response regulator Rcp1